jgi:hypothetical protein
MTGLSGEMKTKAAACSRGWPSAKLRRESDPQPLVHPADMQNRN